ncbi:glycerate kinase, partial [Kitasatospora sp. NPDC127067]|uniref:glycerate kinase family protein n=1 Tax=Kitasatospora sp. NPDC127067 TaxID=3347126 RepID=UPI00364A8D5A
PAPAAAGAGPGGGGGGGGGESLPGRPWPAGGAATPPPPAAALPGTTEHEVPGRTGPDGRPVTGLYALLPDGTALVELAVASGLPLMSRPAPLTATTRGTGETVAAALDAGARRLAVALGGSASTDGGSGLLAALGLRLTDARGRELPDGGGALPRAHRVDATGLRPAPPEGVVLLTDVTNPLLGPDGAAAVYGPQKGADPSEVALLDQGLTRLAALLGADPAQPGAGAAGGTAYGLAAAWGAVIRPGAAAVADLLRLDRDIAAADLVITGEGRYDATSLRGKAVGEVLARAARAGVPARIVAGESADDRVLTLAALAGDPASAREHARLWLVRAGARLAHDAAG